MKHIKLFEYFNSDVNDFMRYIKMTDKEKKEELVNNYSSLASRNNFLDDKYHEIEEVGSIDDIETLYDEYEDDEYTIVEQLKEIYPEVYAILCDYVYDQIEHGDAVSDAEKPSWVYLEFTNIVKADTWLVHITSKEAAYDILQNGFTKGLNDHTTLGLTTHFGDYAKAKGGYNFAYTIPDFIKYARNTDNGGMFRYGDTILLFKAAGVRCYHTTDMEHQVVFYGNTAREIKRLYHDEMPDAKDTEHLDVPSLLANAGKKAVLGFINSQECGFGSATKQKMAELAEKPNGIELIKAANSEFYKELTYYFTIKLEGSGEWYVRDKFGKIAYRANMPEDVLTWFEKNYRLVK